MVSWERPALSVSLFHFLGRQQKQTARMAWNFKVEKGGEFCRLRMRIGFTFGDLKTSIEKEFGEFERLLFKDDDGDWCRLSRSLFEGAMYAWSGGVDPDELSGESRLIYLKVIAEETHPHARESRGDAVRERSTSSGHRKRGGGPWVSRTREGSRKWQQRFDTGLVSEATLTAKRLPGGSDDTILTVEIKGPSSRGMPRWIPFEGIKDWDILVAFLKGTGEELDAVTAEALTRVLLTSISTEMESDVKRVAEAEGQEAMTAYNDLLPKYEPYVSDIVGAVAISTEITEFGAGAPVCEAAEILSSLGGAAAAQDTEVQEFRAALTTLSEFFGRGAHLSRLSAQVIVPHALPRIRSIVRDSTIAGRTVPAETGVTCDRCSCMIRGVRFTRQPIADFDYCAACYALNADSSMQCLLPPCS
eukprot:Polyplicarium_translucidae@DN1915_c0_g1_i2.p1